MPPYAGNTCELYNNSTTNNDQHHCQVTYRYKPLVSVEQEDISNKWKKQQQFRSVNENPYDTSYLFQQQQTQQQKIKKKVCFASTTTTIKNNNKKTYNDVDFNELWYSQKEYDTIYKSCLKTIKWMESVPKIIRKQAESKFGMCTRGLEGMTTVGYRKKIKHTIHSWNAVFEEQQRQRTIGMNDPAFLSDIYFRTTYHRVEPAFTRALRDCIAAYPENRR